MNIYCDAKNMADYGTIVENCWIVGIEMTSYNFESDFELPIDVQFGDSLDEVLSAIEGLNYDMTESYGTYITIYKEGDDDYYQKIYFGLDEDGVLNRVEIVSEPED